jgi:hypothetical protein
VRVDGERRLRSQSRVAGGDRGELFSADDTCDVGKEGGALVAEDYPVPNDFTGEINWVEIDVDEVAEDADHFLQADEVLRVAMARQRGRSSRRSPAVARLSKCTRPFLR